MTQSSAALDRYTARLRRPRLVYFGVVGVIVVALVAFAAVEYSRGEVAHTTLKTVAHPPVGFGKTSPSTSQELRWHTDDKLALGDPVSGGTVVTWSAHTVRGRDARTGEQTWSYTRTDRTVCSALQVSGIAVAVYAVHGDCAEVTALHAGTGKRAWTRTLDEDGVTLTGRASYSTDDDSLLIYASDAMYSINPTSGLDVFTYRRYGCDIERAVVGPAGTLISQNCTHPRCSGVRKCGRGQQLILRSSQGQLDESKPNFDQFIWNDLGNADVPLTAGSLVSALDPTTGAIDTFAASNGRPSTTYSVGAPGSPSAATLRTAAGADISDGAVVWVAGRAAALSASAGRVLWSVDAIAPPTVTGDGDPPDVDTASILAGASGGVAELAPLTGRARTFALPGLPGVNTTTRSYPAGSGFVVGATSGSAAGVVGYQ